MTLPQHPLYKCKYNSNEATFIEYLFTALTIYALSFNAQNTIIMQIKLLSSFWRQRHKVLLGNPIQGGLPARRDLNPGDSS